MVEDIPGLVRQHVTLQVEAADRVYLNGYVPKLKFTSAPCGVGERCRVIPALCAALSYPGG